MMKYAVAIDIGGTNSRVALVDDNYNIIERIQFPTFESDPDATISKIADVINGFDVAVEGIGLSCPGPLDLINGIVLDTPNLHGKWHGFEIEKALAQKTDLPVYLQNDANLAALAEAVIGLGKDKRYVQFLTISTGLGSGQVIDKEIYIGAHGYAHEVANMILWRDGPQHGSILPGGIEAICSGTAITNRALKAGLNVKHAGEVNDLAVAGNNFAASIMDDAKEYLANGIATLIAITDPEIIILGGSVALKIDGFVEEVNNRVKEKIFPGLKDQIEVVKSNLSEDSGLLGGACLVFTKAG